MQKKKKVTKKAKVESSSSEEEESESDADDEDEAEVDFFSKIQCSAKFQVRVHDIVCLNISPNSLSPSPLSLFLPPSSVLDTFITTCGSWPLVGTPLKAVNQRERRRIPKLNKTLALLLPRGERKRRLHKRSWTSSSPRLITPGLGPSIDCRSPRREMVGCSSARYITTCPSLYGSSSSTCTEGKL
jgi:hypothetical protein